MKLYKRLILYYFTGTGNTLKAGKWICEEAEKMDISTSMHLIDKDSKVDYCEIDSKTLIGFLAPTHGFSIAPAMLRFIFKFPSNVSSSVRFNYDSPHVYI